MSDRERLQQQILEFLTASGLCEQPNGGLTGLEKNQNGPGKHRTVTMCVPRSLDGVVRIFAKNFIVVSSNFDTEGTRCHSFAEFQTHIRKFYLQQQGANKEIDG